MNVTEALETLQIKRNDILKLKKAALLSLIRQQYTHLLTRANKLQKEQLTNAIKVMSNLCTEWDEKKHTNAAAMLNYERNNKLIINEKLWHNAKPNDFITSMIHYISLGWGQKQLNQEIRALNDGPTEKDAYKHYIRHFKFSRIKRLVENRCMSMSQVVANPANMDSLMNEKQCPETTFELILNKNIDLLAHINQSPEIFTAQMNEWRQNPPRASVQQPAVSSDEDIDAEAFLASVAQKPNAVAQQPTTLGQKNTASRATVTDDDSEPSLSDGQWVDTLENQLNIIIQSIRKGRNYGTGEGSQKVMALEHIQECLLSTEMPHDEETQQALYRLILSLCEIHRNPLPNLFNAGFKPHSYHEFQAFLKTQAIDGVTTIQLEPKALEKLVTIEKPDDLIHFLHTIASPAKKNLQSGPAD